MQAVFRSYTPADYLPIRDFLVSSFSRFGNPCNWTLDRWNFARHVGQVMHDRVALWEATTGLWEDQAGRILAVVSSAGEEDLEAYFQLAEERPPQDLLIALFEYAEERLWEEREGRRLLHLRIPANHGQMESIALRRGYTRLQPYESMAVIEIGARPPVRLPPGFRITDGREVSAEAQSRAHARAFGYYAQEIYAQRSLRAFALMRQAPDYRPDLDLYVLTESGQVAAFCTMWYDAVNRHGILEPLGTDPDLRRLGLGKAIIGAAMERIAAEGALCTYVGSRQRFYLEIGFEICFTHNIWEKVL